MSKMLCRYEVSIYRNLYVNMKNIDTDIDITTVQYHKQMLF